MKKFPKHWARVKLVTSKDGEETVEPMDVEITGPGTPAKARYWQNKDKDLEPVINLVIAPKGAEDEK